MDDLFSCFSFLALLFGVVFAIAAFQSSSATRKRLDEQERQLRQMGIAIEMLRQHFRELRDRFAPGAAAVPEAPIATAAPEAAEAVEAAVEPMPHPAAEATVEAMREEAAVEAAAFAAEERTPEAIGGAADAPPPPEPPSFVPPAAAAPPPPSPPRFAFDWENLVGVKLFSWIAGIALALAAVFFAKYSVDHGWLTPPIRMALGLITGTALLVVCELKVARNYRVTANAFDGAGIAILYTTLFAAHNIWQLVPAAAVFGLMVLVTVVAVALSIRRDSIFIALLGLLGGFATPALLSTGQDRPFTLFGYLLILNAGLAWLAWRKRWPLLSLLSLIFTTLYQWAWVAEFLDATKLPLAVAIFLLFPLVAVMALWIGGRSTNARGALFERTAMASALLPLLFAGYLAVVPDYGGRMHLLFFFLFCVAAGLAAISVARRGSGSLHLLGGIGTLIVLAIWMTLSWTPAAWPSIVAWVALFVLLYLAVPLVAERLGRPLGEAGERASFIPALLLFVFPLLAAVEPRTASPALLFVSLFAILAIIAAWSILRRAGSVWFTAGFFAIATEGIWSANHLTEARLYEALGVYAAFALLFLGVPVAARRMRRPLEPAIAGPIFLLLSIALLFFLAGGAVAQSALWGVAILLLVINAALFAEASTARHPLLLAAGIALSWLVLAAWWIAASVAAALVPALSIIALFGVFVVAARLLAERRVIESGTDPGLWLALAGHLFLFAVATQKTLALPPWPMLAVVGVLDLAIAIAAVSMRRAKLHGAAIVASHLILLVWVTVAEIRPWSSVAVVTTALLSLFALVWIGVAKRATAPEEGMVARFASVAAGSLFVSQLVTIVASLQIDRPPFALVFAMQLAFLFVLFALSARFAWHDLSIFAAVSSAFAVFLWRGVAYAPETWSSEFLFATVVWLSFIAWPLILGERAAATRSPWLAAVLASGAYFAFAKTSLEWIGFDPYIGVLPVIQALVLLPLVVRLVRMQPPSERDIGRLALVAGTVLAFVTVAIPLQLEKEWITVGWALEGAALIWLFRRIPHRGLLIAATLLLTTSFARLTLNDAIFDYYPRSGTPILNWYLYAYVLTAVAAFFAARLLSKDPAHAEGTRKLQKAFVVFGTVLLFAVLNIEIADFYSTGPQIVFDFSTGLAQDLTYTLGWALFAVAMLVAGIIGRNRAARIASLALLLVSIAKCFLHDLMQLGGLYRVASLAGLAISLGVVAILLQRFVIVARKPEEASV